MIRNVIKASILIAMLVSISSIIQLAIALDLDIENEISNETQHTFAWEPENYSLHKSINLNPLKNSHTQKSLYDSEMEERKFSFEIFWGDGLDELRKNPGAHSKGILPKEDTDSYGISIKQRF